MVLRVIICIIATIAIALGQTLHDYPDLEAVHLKWRALDERRQQIHVKQDQLRTDDLRRQSMKLPVDSFNAQSIKLLQQDEQQIVKEQTLLMQTQYALLQKYRLSTMPPIAQPPADLERRRAILIKQRDALDRQIADIDRQIQSASATNSGKKF